jgi:hypothetical protein
MTFGRYTGIVASTVAAGLVASRPLLTDAAFYGVAFSLSLTGLNAVAAYFLVCWSQSKPTAAFMTAVLGGMMIRMGIMLGAVLVALKILALPRTPVVVSLLASFTAFLALELWATAARRPVTAEVR